MWALSPTPNPPYQPQAGLIGIHYADLVDISSRLLLSVGLAHVGLVRGTFRVCVCVCVFFLVFFKTRVNF